MTAQQLRQVNGSFGLACMISGDKLEPSEVVNLKDDELLMLLYRTDNPVLKIHLQNEKQRRANQ
jgi:hypothetical protein